MLVIGEVKEGNLTLVEMVPTLYDLLSEHDKSKAPQQDAPLLDVEL
jgi:hypothetical protein